MCVPALQVMYNLCKDSWFTYLELLVFLQASGWPYQLWVSEDRSDALRKGATRFTCSWNREELVGCVLLVEREFSHHKFSSVQ